MTRAAALTSLPRVSFVIPVRDDAQRLRGCLDSIARNDYPADLVEVVVVDNGSKDGSVEAAREAGAVVVSQPRGRVAQLRNEGAAVASGRVLAFVDADHEICPGWIRAAVIGLSSQADVAAIGALCDPPRNANWVQTTYDRLRAKSAGRHDADWLGSGNLAIEHAAFDAVGGFDAALDSCEDVDLCNRLKTAGFRILSDSELRNVHLGDPSTLSAVFWGELWRGRNNLRVTLRGPRTARHLRSVMVPAVDLVAIGGALATAAFDRPVASLLCSLVVLALSFLRTTTMIRPPDWNRPIRVIQCFVVALVYDVARAFALIARTSHGSRRLRGESARVPANSHS
jgi:GT2 family glycosyltransferase